MKILGAPKRSLALSIRELTDILDDLRGRYPEIEWIVELKGEDPILYSNDPQLLEKWR